MWRFVEARKIMHHRHLPALGFGILVAGIGTLIALSFIQDPEVVEKSRSCPATDAWPSFAVFCLWWVFSSDLILGDLQRMIDDSFICTKEEHLSGKLAVLMIRILLQKAVFGRFVWYKNPRFNHLQLRIGKLHLQQRVCATLLPNMIRKILPSPLWKSVKVWSRRELETGRLGVWRTR